METARVGEREGGKNNTIVLYSVPNKQNSKVLRSYKQQTVSLDLNSNPQA